MVGKPEKDVLIFGTMTTRLITMQVLHEYSHFMEQMNGNLFDADMSDSKQI